MSYIQDKTIVITGASSGIGRASAIALADRGAKIVAVGRDQGRLDSLVQQIAAAGGEASALVADVTQPEQGKRIGEFAKQTYGSVDVLLNNAGLMLFSYWSDFAVQDWEKMIDTNIKGYLHAIAGILPIMLEQKSGQIINMDSVAGHQVDPAAGIYCATKFFVQAMTESMRKDLGVTHGIRASTISPGVINTGWADKVTDPNGRKAAQELNKIAISPEDVAKAVVFAIDQPASVTVNDLIISPTRQDW